MERAFQPARQPRQKLPSNKVTCAQLADMDTGFLENSDLAKIKCKVAKPNFVFGRLVEKTEPKHYDHLAFLTQMFFHFFGSRALRQVADACAALRNLVFREVSLSKALDEMEDGAPIIYRLILVLLLEDRQRRELAYCQVRDAKGRGARWSRAKDDTRLPQRARRPWNRPDSNVLTDMMAEQYPELDPSDPNYKTSQKRLRNRLDVARNWQMAQKRRASALWMYPCGPGYLSTDNYLMTIFLDLLQELCGEFIQEMDNLLACQLEDHLKGRRPLRNFQFEQLDLETLQSYDMDSDDFLSICKPN